MSEIVVLIFDRVNSSTLNHWALACLDEERKRGQLFHIIDKDAGQGAPYCYDRVDCHMGSFRRKYVLLPVGSLREGWSATNVDSVLKNVPIGGDGDWCCHDWIFSALNALRGSRSLDTAGSGFQPLFNNLRSRYYRRALALAS
jgi:hypothetical protein